MDDVLVIQCPDWRLHGSGRPQTGAVLSHEPAATKRKLGSFEEAAAENARRKERANDLFAATVEREKPQERDPREDLPRGAREGQKEPPAARAAAFDDD